MPPAPENNRAAQALALMRLGHLQIVILDYDIPAAQLIRKALSAISITQTILSRDSRDVLAMLAERPVDILIVAYESRPDNGLEVTRTLRSPESPNRALPIILTTGASSEELFHEARDAGVNEIMVKPFNMRVMLERITAIIDQPRQFVLAPNYAGPCRRRGVAVPPEGVEERRGRDPQKEPVVVGKDALREVFIDQRPRLIRPDFSLKQRLEAAASRMAGLENLLPQAEAERMGEDFVQWMMIDLTTIRQATRLLAGGPENLRVGLENITKATMTLRTRALTSGYVLAARVAVALHDFCQKWFDIEHPNHLMIITKHVDTLHAILANRLTGEDNPVARELVQELQLLVKKYI